MFLPFIHHITIERFTLSMPSAHAPSGAFTSLGRGLQCLLLAGVALAGVPAAYAQDTGLRSSILDDPLLKKPAAQTTITTTPALGQDSSGQDSSGQDGFGQGNAGQENAMPDSSAQGSTEDQGGTADDSDGGAFTPNLRTPNPGATNPDTAANPAAGGTDAAATGAKTATSNSPAPAGTGPRVLTLDNMRVGTITSDDSGDTDRVQRENLRQLPEQGRAVTPDADPFAPVGIRAGSFILRPSLEQGLRVTSNGNNSSTGSSATLSETTLQLNAQSDWGRHQATLNASGTMSKSIAGQSVSQPQVNIDGKLRLDLADQTTVNAEAGYQLQREDASSPNGVVGALKQPLVHHFSGSLGVERDLGLFFGSITGGLEHDLYGDAKLDSGGTVSQKGRDNTYANLKLRGGFTISPALKPFVEAEIGRRMFDDRFDSNGYQRSGDQYALRAGVMVDMSEKLKGEFSAGYMRVNSDDHRLDSVSGPSVSASLDWSPLRGTDVKLYAQTLVDPSTTPGINASLMQIASLGIVHQIRSDLSVNGQVDTVIRQNNDGTGTDYTIGAQLGATYWFSRYVGLDTRLRHEFLTSKVSSREYTANSIYVGLKIQR